MSFSDYRLYPRPACPTATCIYRVLLSGRAHLDVPTACDSVFLCSLVILHLPVRHHSGSCVRIAGIPGRSVHYSAPRNIYYYNIQTSCPGQVAEDRPISATSRRSRTDARSKLKSFVNVFESAYCFVLKRYPVCHLFC